MLKWDVDPDRWDELSWQAKHLMIARCRANDTMQAWEEYQAMR